MPGRSTAQLATLVGGELIGSSDTLVFDVTHDSRMAGPGVMFVAVRGSSEDGHSYVGRFVDSGGAAVCVDHDMGVDVPQIVVADTRAAMAPLAAEVHGHPSRDLSVVGVTGTNGKTTVTHYVESIAAGAGLVAGLIGTVHTRVGERLFPSERTTPESTDLQRLLAEMRDLGCRLVAAEVSSHALALGRVDATRFEVAAFTNLSRDHLDFHGDMDSYLAAKKRLFHDLEVGTSVVNVSDPAGRELAGEISGPLVTVGEGADVSATSKVPTPRGTAFHLGTPWGSADVEAMVHGGFNVDNALMAAACSLAVGVGFDDVVAGLAALPGVPGRFEVISGDDPVRVIVDYAHTPEGVRLALETARGLGRGRVIALVGAGGDRDRDKRPMMGAALSSADVALVTSDNPRSEDPLAIIEAVHAGVAQGTSVLVEPDRRRAIEMALRMAAPGDTVLVLGRGHEPFQEIAGRRVPFDDREVARHALAELRSSAKSGPDVGSMGA